GRSSRCTRSPRPPSRGYGAAGRRSLARSRLAPSRWLHGHRESYLQARLELAARVVQQLVQRVAVRPPVARELVERHVVEADGLREGLDLRPGHETEVAARAAERVERRAQQEDPEIRERRRLLGAARPQGGQPLRVVSGLHRDDPNGTHCIAKKKRLSCAGPDTDTTGDHMRVTAAVLYDVNKPYSVESVELDPPKRGEVLIKVGAAGVCRSDLHFQQGEATIALPAVLGHEGAGTVQAVGEGVSMV